MLTWEKLHREMVYENGRLFWRKPGQGRRVDGNVGTVDREGYVRINFLREHYMEHRLIWLYHYGVMPTGQLDHINQDPSDNRIENLREVTNRENNLNKKQSNRTIPPNIYFHHGKYRVDILYKGTRYKSISYKTVEEAIEERELLLEKAGLT